jgi:demethylmenaquinone methyltransferase/2-methoxy-6-polyprenyl-1,4-benzoquinol methylase
LAVFWWSHVPRQRIGEFLASLHARLEPGARVVLMDNLYVDGSSTAISEIDGQGNTYQLRRLADGSRVRVLKNFPSEDELRSQLPAPLSYEALQYYWLAEYRLA